MHKRNKIFLALWALVLTLYPSEPWRISNKQFYIKGQGIDLILITMKTVLFPLIWKVISKIYISLLGRDFIGFTGIIPFSYVLKAILKWTRVKIFCKLNVSVLMSRRYMCLSWNYFRAKRIPRFHLQLWGIFFWNRELF